MMVQLRSRIHRWARAYAGGSVNHRMPKRIRPRYVQLFSSSQLSKLESRWTPPFVHKTRCHATSMCGTFGTAADWLQVLLARSSTLPFEQHHSAPSTSSMAPSRAPFVCATCCKFLARPSSSRAFSTTTSHPQRSRDAAALASEDTPRWMTVPHRMRMPLRLRPQPRGPVWKVNTEQAPVDEMYDKFFVKTGGTADGRNVLSDEIKVYPIAIVHRDLTLTHSSSG